MSDIELKSPPMNGIEALQILFIALRLLGKIDWSWWWVLAPIWITVIVLLALFLVNKRVNG
jgi:hypothetical protein